MANEELCIMAQAGDTAARDMLLENSQDFIRKIEIGRASCRERV